MRVYEILSELTGIKGFVSALEPDAGHDSWQQLLAQQGFVPIGRGYHGQVYSNPHLDYVLKVFTKEDTAYQYWASACRGPLKGNAYVPVFRGGIVRITDSALAVRMESLSVALAEHKEKARQIAVVLRTARQQGQDWQQILPQFMPGGVDKELYEVIAHIQAGIDRGYMLDLKGANVMSRGSQQLVITDPLA